MESLTELLDRVDEYCEKATGGEWQWLPDEGQFIVSAKGNIVAEVPCQGCNADDGAFIVAVVNAYPRLSAALREMMGENDRLREALSSIANHPHNSYEVSTVDVADGHRCAAQIARTALAATEKKE